LVVKLCLIIKLIHLMRIVIFFFLYIPVLALSQDTLTISFNEPIRLELRNSKFDFTIQNQSEKVELNETNINQYIFKKIGLNTVLVKSRDVHAHEHDCTHVHISDLLYVYVDSVRIKFDPNSIKTSKPIIQNQSTEGIDLYIDVEIENYFQSKVVMNTSTIYSAGIGTEIKADLDKEFYKLSSGKHRLVYHLSGICSQPSYIQFDFVHHHGKFEPIPLTIPVAKN
jgi:hypothetical protein